MQDIKKELVEEDFKLARNRAGTIRPNFDLKSLPMKLLATQDKKELLKLLQGLHERFWHAPAHDMKTFLRLAGIIQKNILQLIDLVPQNCPECRDFARQTHKPQTRITIAVRFNQRVQGDIFFVWDLIILLLIDDLDCRLQH